MKDSAERALSEAKTWLRSAEMTLQEAEENDASVAVACAEAIHSIIRANDALALHFLKKKGTRHDDAPFLFLEIVRQGKIEKDDEKYADLLVEAMRSKSGADYGKEEFNLKQAEYFTKKAKEFIEMVEKYANA